MKKSKQLKGRKVKCYATGEIGNSLTFYKAPDKHYYKNKKIYEQRKRDIELHKQIIDIIVDDFLNYQHGQKFPTILTKKLAELKFYPNEVILKTIEKCKSTIQYYMDNKEFDSDYGKIGYIFAIIVNNINDIYRDWKRNQIIETKQTVQNIENQNITIENIGTKNTGKDISKWLED